MFASWKLCQSSLFAMALGRCYRVVTCKHWFSVPTYKPDDGYLRVDYDVANLIITSFQKCMVALWKCVLELSIDKTHIIVRQAKTFAWITEKLLIKYHDRLHSTHIDCLHVKLTAGWRMHDKVISQPVSIKRAQCPAKEDSNRWWMFEALWKIKRNGIPTEASTSISSKALQ